MVTAICKKIESNFEVSILLPWYKKYQEFRFALQKNAPYFQRNGIEVIIIMDDATDEDQLITLIRQYPLINWKVLVNRTPHEWRNPVKVLNVGLRHASKKYVLAMDPESELYSDVIFHLRYMAELYPQSYFLGRVIFSETESVLTEDSISNYQKLPYGSILARRKDLLAIRGYDEKFTYWGGDDNNIRSRLDFYGCNCLHVPQAILVHRESNNNEQHKSRTEKYQHLPVEHRKYVFYPDTAIANGANWGTDFSECLYNYASNNH